LDALLKEIEILRRELGEAKKQGVKDSKPVDPSPKK
jgi:hypothetical protein